MLTQVKADQLMGMTKRLVDRSVILFPLSGKALQLDAKSEDNIEMFIFDVNRKGKIKTTKCTYQERWMKNLVLIRLCINGKTHRNPDGNLVPTPHIHVYQAGFDDGWAQPVPAEFANLKDLVGVLVDFFKHCNVIDVPEIQRRMF